MSNNDVMQGVRATIDRWAKRVESSTPIQTTSGSDTSASSLPTTTVPEGGATTIERDTSGVPMKPPIAKDAGFPGKPLMTEESEAVARRGYQDNVGSPPEALTVYGPVGHSPAPTGSAEFAGVSVGLPDLSGSIINGVQTPPSYSPPLPSGVGNAGGFLANIFRGR